MHPRIREILDYIDASHRELREAVDRVPEALRGRRPAPESWSVAQVIDHLAVVEERVANVVIAALADLSGVGEERDTSPVVPTVPVARLMDRAQPLVASDASQPKGLEMDAAWAALEARRAAIRDALQGADGRALGDVRVPHPRLGELNVYQWVVFVGAHEARHAAQVREIAGALQAV